MTISRRTLITGLSAIICAPAIVRASSLMSVREWRNEDPLWREKYLAQGLQQLTGYDEETRVATVYTFTTYAGEFKISNFKLSKNDPSLWVSEFPFPTQMRAAQ